MAEELVPIQESQLEAQREAIERAIALVHDRLIKLDVNKHYKRALRYLDDNQGYFLTDVLNLGKPKWTHQIPTAGVGFLKNDKKGKKIEFVFNPVFASLLEVEDLAFIISHETMHVLLNHPKLMQREMKKGRNPAKLNVSMDAVINDWLLEGGFYLSDDGMAHACLGEKVVGHSCANSTVMEVYRQITDETMEKMFGNNSLMGEYLGQSGGNVTGDHEWMDEADPDEVEAVAQPTGSIKRKKDKEEGKRPHAYGVRPGSEKGMMQRFQEQAGVGMRWAELLKQVNPDMFKPYGKAPKPSYHASRRKLIGLAQSHPDLGSLPVTKQKTFGKGETPTIVMFLDGSGSCSNYINTFMTLAKSVPKEKIRIFAYTFSTYVVPFSLEADSEHATGGTEFSIIEDEIHRSIIPKINHYPKAVVVLTDGIGYFSSTKVEDKFSKNWLWMVTEQGSRCINPRPGVDVNIEEFTRGINWTA